MKVVAFALIVIISSVGRPFIPDELMNIGGSYIKPTDSIPVNIIYRKGKAVVCLIKTDSIDTDLGWYLPHDSDRARVKKYLDSLKNYNNKNHDKSKQKKR